jgi:hypothetical protein
MEEAEVRELLDEITTHPEPEQEYEPRRPPNMSLQRLAGRGDVWVAELVSDYGDREPGGIFNVCLILEFADGLIRRETRYYREPFEAPEARSQWRLPDKA